MARLTISNAENGNQVFFNEVVEPGSEVVIGLPDGQCIPDSLRVFVAYSQSLDVTQSFTIDSSCECRGLLLLERYGALNFNGYSCNRNYVHNCFLGMPYKFDACGIGMNPLEIMNEENFRRFY